MKFKASQQLVDILVENGFKETTTQWYPEHAEGIMKGDYDPRRHKRILSRGGRNFIQLDYLAICPCYNNACDANEIRYLLTCDELKSIIAFYKLPFHSKAAFKRQEKLIPDLYKEYEKIRDNPGWYKSDHHQKLKVTFETIMLTPAWTGQENKGGLFAC